MSSPLHPALSGLPRESRSILENSVRPKFNAYFDFTRGLERCRDLGNGVYLYPNDSVVSDLQVIAMLFSEVYETFNKTNSLLNDFANALASHDDLRHDFLRIVEGGTGLGNLDGSFWIFEGPEKEPVVVSPVNAVSPENLKKLLRTLRNGFLHFHWKYEDLSALEYWQSQEWSVVGAPRAFDFPGREKNNYMAYVVDAPPGEWKSKDFWQMKDLRILVTPYANLRFHLHLSLQQLLNNTRVHVFETAIDPPPSVTVDGSRIFISDGPSGASGVAPFKG